jgi:O-antigen/teichoic acid export membrane protein
VGYTKDAVKGFSWMGAFRVVTRVLSLGRTAILARLLLPAQFGVFGIASLVLSFLEIITETGINLFLIQENEGVKKYINTAWIISIIRGVIIAIAILLLASPISVFFKSATSYNLLLLISAVPLIRGFINPAVVKYQIDLEFNKEFLYRSFLFGVDAAVAIVIAFKTHSAVSLIWGFIVSALVEAVTSFIFFKIKPKMKFNVAQARKIIKRGKWITLGGIFKYLVSQGDDAVVARLLNTTQLGYYQNAYKISTLPVTEVSGVAAKVVMPVYVKIRGDRKRLKRAFLKAFATVFAIAVPFGFIIFAFSQQIISVVLGKNWLAAEPVLRVLAIFGIISAIGNIPNPLFISIKRQDIFAKVRTLQFLGLAFSIIPLTLRYGIVGAAYSTLVASIISSPYIFYNLKKVLSESEK